MASIKAVQHKKGKHTLVVCFFFFARRTSFAHLHDLRRREWESEAQNGRRSFLLKRYLALRVGRAECTEAIGDDTKADGQLKSHTSINLRQSTRDCFFIFLRSAFLTKCFSALSRCLYRYKIFSTFFKKPIDKLGKMFYNLNEPNGSQRKRRAI